MRYPTATAAAAAETCKNERRERQAGFSSMGMVIPPNCRSHAANWLHTNYHVPRLADRLFGCIFLLASICASQRCFSQLRRKWREEKEKTRFVRSCKSELTSLQTADCEGFWWRGGPRFPCTYTNLRAQKSGISTIDWSS